MKLMKSNYYLQGTFSGTSDERKKENGTLKILNEDKTTEIVKF